MRFIIPGQRAPFFCSLGWHKWGPRQWIQSRRRYTSQCERSGCRARLTWDLERF